MSREISLFEKQIVRILNDWNEVSYEAVGRVARGPFCRNDVQILRASVQTIQSLRELLELEIPQAKRDRLAGSVNRLQVTKQVLTNILTECGIDTEKSFVQGSKVITVSAERGFKSTFFDVSGYNRMVVSLEAEILGRDDFITI